VFNDDFDIVVLVEVVAGQDRAVSHAHLLQTLLQVLFGIVLFVWNCWKKYYIVVLFLYFKNTRKSNLNVKMEVEHLVNRIINFILVSY
jgi:hypothetical protein